MLNKKILFVIISIFITNFSYAAIVGIGQIGDKYIYKVNGVVVSVSPGDIIDGCIVVSGSGMQCSSLNNKTKNKTFVLEKIVDKVAKMDRLTFENKQLKKDLAENNVLKNKALALNKTYSSRIQFLEKKYNNKINSLKADSANLSSLDEKYREHVKSLEDQYQAKINSLNAKIIDIQSYAVKSINDKNIEINKISAILNKINNQN